MLLPFVIFLSFSALYYSSNNIIKYYDISKQLLTNKLARYIVDIHKHYYIVHYPFGVHWYKIYIPRNRKPCKINAITDENDNNVKDDIFLIMGPSYNFHGILSTPEMFGFEKLKFEYLNGDIKEFSKNETILF